MSIEQLEELETKYSTLTVSSEKNGTEYTEVDVEDLVFLIQNGFKQAERVQELESTVKHAMKAIDNTEAVRVKLINAEQQNKRYREALEKIKLNVRICGNEEYFPKVVEEIVNEALVVEQ